MKFTKDNPRYAKYSIGRYTYGEPSVVDWGHANSKLIIGSFCCIARGVEVFLGGEHRSKWVTSYPLNHVLQYDPSRRNKHLYEQEHSNGDVIIGNDVWLGSEAFILSGSTIGDGCIIGAKTVVRGNIPPYAVVYGNPCVIKRYRYSEDVIHNLLKIKWWDWDDEKIKENIPLLMCPDADGFVKKFGGI